MNREVGDEQPNTSMAAPGDQGKEDQWSQEDMLTLLETMKSILPSQDSLKFKTTESQLDWNKLAFKNYTGPVCRQKWIEISTKVRKFRTLSEVIQSAEEHVKNKYKGKKLKKHPKFPKIPLTSYMRYFVENRAKYAKLHPEMGNVDLTKMLSKKYKELPEKRKMKYSQDYQRKKQEFKRNLAKFREEHPDLMQATKKTDVPETPKTAEEIWQRTVIGDFLAQFKNNRAKAITCMESTWLNMEENKKIIWIKKAEDQKLSEREVRDMRSAPAAETSAKKMKFMGEPQKPAMSGYQMFSRELLSNGELNHLPQRKRMVEVGSRWQRISPSQKEYYKKLTEDQQRLYCMQLERWMKGLSSQDWAAYKEKTAYKCKGATKTQTAQRRSKRNGATKTQTSSPKSKATAQSRSDDNDDEDEVEDDNDYKEASI